MVSEKSFIIIRGFNTESFPQPAPPSDDQHIWMKVFKWYSKKSHQLPPQTSQKKAQKIMTNKLHTRVERSTRHTPITWFTILRWRWTIIIKKPIITAWNWLSEQVLLLSFYFFAASEMIHNEIETAHRISNGTRIELNYLNYVELEHFWDVSFDVLETFNGREIHKFISKTSFKCSKHFFSLILGDFRWNKSIRQPIIVQKKVSATEQELKVSNKSHT